MKYRVIHHKGCFQLEYKNGGLDGWLHGWQLYGEYDNKDEALYVLTSRLELKRRELEQSEKIVIAEEKV